MKKLIIIIIFSFSGMFAIPEHLELARRYSDLGITPEGEIYRREHIKLAGLFLCGENLSNLDLRAADLRGTNFDCAILFNLKLNGADIRNASFGYLQDWQWIDLDKGTKYNVRTINSITSKSFFKILKKYASFVRE